MVWRVAKSLLQLRDQVNAAAPNRGKLNDGTIGDSAHSARKSEHNPNQSGVVCAMDITHDPQHGCDSYALAETLRKNRDKRIKFIISNRKICSPPSWAWRPYKGSNPHDHHVHISVKSPARFWDDTSPWDIAPLGAAVVAKVAMPFLLGTASSAATISKSAIDFIIEFEVTSKEVYQKLYQHPTWPQGASGVTIGIGYDCGYINRAELHRDWDGILEANKIARLEHVAGITGGSAHQASHGVHDVMVSWDQAYKEFAEREIPKWIARTASHLTNIEKLSPTSFGVLVSLAYNRGPSFDNRGERFLEMRAIKMHLANNQFAAIADDIRRMTRLWPNVSGLRRRRRREADLFEQGLGDAPMGSERNKT